MSVSKAVPLKVGGEWLQLHPMVVCCEHVPQKGWPIDGIYY